MCNTLENKIELLCVGVGEISSDDDSPNSIGGQYVKKTKRKTKQKPAEACFNQHLILLVLSLFLTCDLMRS